MRRMVIASAMVLTLSACGRKQDTPTPETGAGNMAADAGTMSGGSQPGANPADWTDRWWKSDNPEPDKGPFVDIDPTTPLHEHFTITFKKDVDDTGRKADGEATPQGTDMPFVIDGQRKSFAIVTGKGTGVPALAARRRCVVLSPDKTIYCLD